MELKQFIQNVIKDLVEGVEEIRPDLSRNVLLTTTNETGRTVEFDIAVAVENKDSSKGIAGIKVLEFFQVNGDKSSEMKNSTVSRIKFGISIDPRTNVEIEEDLLKEKQRITNNNANQNQFV